MKKRIISAIVMAIILIPLLILGGHFFAAAVGVIAALAYKEIVNLKKEGYPNIMLFLGFLSLISLVFSNYVNCSIYLGITYQIIAFCILVMLIPVIFFNIESLFSVSISIFTPVRVGTLYKIISIFIASDICL